MRNRVVCLDGRNYHQVEPVTEGTRYSIYFFKNYDRRWKEKKPHTDNFSIVYNGGRGSASGGGGASGGGDPPKPRAARKSPRTKRTVKQRTDRQLSGSTRVATMQEIDKDGPPGGVKDDEGPGMGWT